MARVNDEATVFNAAMAFTPEETMMTPKLLAVSLIVILTSSIQPIQV